MKYSGVIFDFNGTLFWDTPLHNKAWNIFLEKRGIHLSDNDFFTTIHGKNNRDIFAELFKRDLTVVEIRQLSDEKEELYRALCLETDLSLAPGATSLFEDLKEKQIPFTIATASDKKNVDFYFRHLDIGKWFDRDKVVYNNGKIKGKPHPDIYLTAMQVIGKRPEEVLVFEDAVAGLQAAKNAQAGGIIAVNSNNDDYSAWSAYPVIRDFDEVDRTILRHT